MVNNKSFFFLFLFFLLLSLTSSELYGYGRTRIIPVNQSIATVNNSIFWDGHVWSNYRWLTVSGSNANQDIDISPYDFSASHFIGDGSQLTNITAGNPFNQDLNTYDNVEFVNVTGKNGTFEYMNITKDLYVSNATLYIGNVSMSSSEINGTKQLLIPQTEVFATFFVGDGSKLTNITFENGTIIADAINSSVYIGGNFTGDNFTGLNFYGGNFYGVYDWVAELPWLNFNGTYLEFNETKLKEEAEVTVNELNTIIVTSGGSGSNISIPIDFLITRITVTPNSLSTKYRFEATETSTGDYIDKDRKTHKGKWDIEKSYALNDTVTFNISSAVPDDTFTIKLTYLNNFD